MCVCMSVGLQYMLRRTLGAPCPVLLKLREGIKKINVTASETPWKVVSCRKFSPMQHPDGTTTSCPTSHFGWNTLKSPTCVWFNGSFCAYTQTPDVSFAFFVFLDPGRPRPKPTLSLQVPYRIGLEETVAIRGASRRQSDRCAFAGANISPVRETTSRITRVRNTRRKSLEGRLSGRSGYHVSKQHVAFHEGKLCRLIGRAQRVFFPPIRRGNRR